MNSLRRAVSWTSRIVLWLVGALAVACAAILLLLWLAARSALPETDGAVTLAGLHQTVTIARDHNGIPLIQATSDDDAYFALGYLHAQDRLFEMELMRRQGQGRLAEIIGPLAVRSDRFMRTLGVYRRTEADLTKLDPAVQRAFERYAAGVNAWLSEGHPLPLEFRLLWFKPEPWRPADSLVWQKLMGLELTGNWDEELFNAALIAKLGPERAKALLPNPRAGEPTTAAANDDLRHRFAALRPLELLRAMTAVIPPTLASNVWVVAGSRTTSGKPLLANDPHLGFQAPSIWYFAGIEAPDLRVFGATIPGVPLLVLGHNQSLAWGLTTTHSDTSDLFIEQASEDGKTYAAPDGPQPFTTRTETIAVRFGKPVTITVRETRHGPVVSDILPPQPDAPDFAAQHQVLALAASVLQPGDQTGEALYRMNRANTVETFIDDLKLFDAPQQNIMVADDAGTIAYYAPGRVPIRKGGDGSVPAPGWSGDYDWTGWIPFEALPHAINPPAGFLVNANNKMVGDDYPYLLTSHWMDAYRASRITQLLSGTEQSSMATMQAMQQDAVSLMERELLPLLLAHAGEIPKSERPLLDGLAQWDGTMDRQRWEPLVFALWLERTKAAILADELGPLYREFGGERPEVLRNILTTDTTWCDDVTTPDKVESCDDQVAKGWSQALAWLKDHGIADPTTAHWGDLHVATFGNILFQNLPVVNRLGMLRIASSGDDFTINRGSFEPSTARQPFRHFHGASLRAVYDLADLAKSQFALPGGESGELGSGHYGDLLEAWRDGRYFNAPRAGDAVDWLTLRPEAPGKGPDKSS